MKDANDATWRRLAGELILDREVKVGDLVEEIQRQFAASVEGSRVGLIELKVEGVAKPLQVYVPEGYTADKSWPLMVLLHGTNGSGKGMLETALGTLKKEKWILVAPSLKKPSLGDAMKTAGTTGLAGATIGVAWL